MRIKLGAVCAAVALAAAFAASGQQSRSFSGGGEYVSVLGRQVEFGASGVETPKGTVKGSGQVQIKSFDFKVQFRTLDLVFDGNTVWLLGEVTKGDAGGLAGLIGGQDLAGWRFINAVQDNGEGANAAPDRASGSPAWFPPGTGPSSITQGFINALVSAFPPVAPISEMTKGNIQVSNG